MPGKVIKVDVAEKEEVRKNQTLAIVEAMKMENVSLLEIYASPDLSSFSMEERKNPRNNAASSADAKKQSPVP